MFTFRSTPMKTVAASFFSRIGESDKLAVALISLVTTIVLTLAKLFLGLISGSLALVADGLQGVIDISVTLITLTVVFSTACSACPTWTVGRDKLEAFAALAEALLLAIIASFVMYLALEKLALGSHDAAIEPWYLLVVGVAIIADYARARLVGAVAKRTGSMALEANAAHFMTDSIGSLVVLVGLFFAQAGWPVADTLATSALACLLFYTAYRVGSRAASMLVDKADPKDSLRVLETLRARGEVIDIPLLRMHRRLGGYNVVAEVEVAHGAAEDLAALREGLTNAVSRAIPNSSVIIACRMVAREAA